MLQVGLLDLQHVQRYCPGVSQVALNKSLALREDRVNLLLLAFDLVLPGVGNTPVLVNLSRRPQRPQ
jgi:hypothetical protein